MSHFTKEQRNKSILDDFVYEDTNRERSTWLFSSIDSDHFSLLLTFNLHIYKYMQGWVQEYSVDTCRKQNIPIYIVVIHLQYHTGVFLKRPEHTKFFCELKVRLINLSSPNHSPNLRIVYREGGHLQRTHRRPTADGSRLSCTLFRTGFAVLLGTEFVKLGLASPKPAGYNPNR